jgi:hypothetical protein
MIVVAVEKHFIFILKDIIAKLAEQTFALIVKVKI